MESLDYIKALQYSLVNKQDPKVMLQLYKFQYQFSIIMKKAKVQRTPHQAITLSSKRGSLNQEQLCAQYKADWRQPPLQNLENSNSKVFFQNMKAELSNIKNDFQKLIRKEINLNSEKDEDYKPSSVSSKNKCQSAYKKEPKRMGQDRLYENEKLGIVMNNGEDNDNFFKILNLERNLPCSSGADIKSSYSKTVTMKDNIVKASKNINPFDAIELQKNQKTHSSRGQRPVETYSAFHQEKDWEKQAQKLKQSLSILQKQLARTQEERDFTKMQAEKLYRQKNIYVNKITELSNELGNKVDVVMQQQSRIQRLSQQLGRCQQGLQNAQNFSQQFTNERVFYTQRINELMFHNQNLGSINMQMGNQNQQLKENLISCQRFVQQTQRRSNQIELDYKRKMQYLQKDILQYQKRQDMFTRQIQKLNSQIHKTISTQSISIPTCDTLSADTQALQEQIIQLKDQVAHLIKQVNIEKQIHQAVNKRYEDQIASLKIQQLSKEFEEKINTMVQQNCRLKTKINHLQSSFQSIQEQNRSLVSEIELYQERNHKQVQNRQMSFLEYEQLKDEIQRLKEENKKLSEELEFKKLKLQTEKQYEIPNQSGDSLIRLAHSQLLENQKLKESIKQLSEKLKHSQSKLEGLRISQERMSFSATLNGGNIQQKDLQKKYDQLYSQSQKRRNQVMNLKEIIFKVIIEKASIFEDEEQMQYYLRQLNNLKDRLSF